jgi:DNA-binding CsgD family transcriptional regulator
MESVNLSSDDRAAILDVIKRETDTFVSGDFQSWASCWVQDNRTRAVCYSSTFGVTILQGWTDIERYMKDVIQNGFACEVVEFNRDNINLTINGDMAFITFDGRSVHSDARVESTFETRVLEQKSSEWRFLHSSFVLHGHLREDAKRLAIDSRGRVLCAPEEALSLLKAHPALQLKNGRLRATRPAWDEVLQAGIQCASEQHQYFQHYRYATQHRGNFRLPLVLGELDHGGVAVCTLFVRDEMTLVEIQGEHDITDKLKLAKAIFSLSDGQLALAQRIIGGSSLVAAADDLGISINSVKTHLSRIYVKTGVNSQTALVRTLLSLG